MSLDDLSEVGRAALAQQLGEILLRAPRLAKQAGHKYPLNTIRDYVRPGEGHDEVYVVAAAYLKDLITRPHGKTTDEIMTSWFAEGTPT